MREITPDMEDTQRKHSLSCSPPLRSAPPKARLVVYAFWLGMLLVVSGLLVMNYQQLTLLARDGRTTNARITAKRAYATRSSDYYVDFEFTARGRQEGSLSVSKEVYQQSRVGDLFTITYLPANPTITQRGKVDEERATSAGRTGLLCFFFLSLVFGGFTCYMERYYRR